MIIDTEKDQLIITISLDDAFELLRGNGLSDDGWKHLAGVLGEWYHDTWNERDTPNVTTDQCSNKLYEASQDQSKKRWDIKQNGN